MKYKWTIVAVVITLSAIAFFVFGKGGDDFEIAKNNFLILILRNGLTLKMLKKIFKRKL